MRALQDVDFTLREGEIHALMGENGAGKSTLVRCLNFLEKPTTGTVLIENKDLSAMSGKELRKTRTEIAMIFQHFNLLMQRTVIDNICFPLEITKVSRKDALARARELLEIVGLSEKELAYPAQLSGGEQQRVAIARSLSSGARILLADEPTGNLDEENTKNIISIFRRLAHELGYCIIVVTHDNEIAAISDAVWKMTDGELVHYEAVQG